MSLRARALTAAPTAAAGPGRTRLQHVLEAGLRAQELREQAQPPPPPQPQQVMDVGDRMCRSLNRKAKDSEKAKAKLVEKRTRLNAKLEEKKTAIAKAYEMKKPAMAAQYEEEADKLKRQIETLDKEISQQAGRTSALVKGIEKQPGCAVR